MTPHSSEFRVYYADTDAGGVVYHANYLNFMERARTEMLRYLGISVADMANQEGLLFVVGDIHARYKAPARLDDLLVVETSVKALGGASLALRQNIRKQVASGDSLLLEGIVTLVLITRDGKPARLPQGLRDALTPYLMEEDYDRKCSDYRQS